MKPVLPFVFLLFFFPGGYAQDNYKLKVLLCSSTEYGDREEAFFCSGEDETTECTLYRLRQVCQEKQGKEKMYEYMGKAIDSSKGHLTETSNIELVLFYANMLEQIGESYAAKRYYEYALNAEHSEEFYTVLAKISLTGLKGNTEEILRTTDHFDTLTESFSAADKILLAFRMSRYISNIDYLNLLSSLEGYLEGVSDADLKIEYLKIYLYLAATYRGQNIDRLADELLGTYDRADINRIRVPYRYHTFKGEYKDALEQARLAVEDVFGPFDTNEQLLDMYEASSLHPWDKVIAYAHAQLYQTRIGADISVVKNAFSVFQGVYDLDLTDRIERSYSISAEPSNKLDPKFNNPLVIGNYLHAATGEERYLDASLSILDGYIGAGTLFWVAARERMRWDGTFAGALEEILRQEMIFRSLPETTSLPDLFAQEQLLRSLRETFRAEYADFYDSLRQQRQLRLADLRTFLATDTAGLVGFYINEEILYRFFISSDTTEIRKLKNVDSEVQRLTHALAARVSNPDSSAAIAADSYRLYSLLFAGLDSLLPPRLYVVATGALIDIPFAVLRTLPPDTTAQYLGLTHALSRQFSIGSMCLLANQERQPAKAYPLVFAPSFQGEPLAATSLRQAGFLLPPLTYNQDEARAIAELGYGKYLYGSSATRAIYRARASEHGILHLASHAISSKTNGIESRIFLLDDVGAPEALYASDLGQQTLAAELVVLSACETGNGGQNIVEGRVGLTKAYLSAGARSVVASDWSVDDYATASMMETFYAATAEGVAPDEALRRARVAYLREHPEASVADWGAFAAYGGMVAPRWERASRWSDWWWLAAVGGVALGLFVWVRRLF